jgi:hypothetical protein
VTNEERLKAAGWRPTCDRKWPWTRDGKMWFTEDEALVVVLTAERDAAIARAERAEAERDDANGRRDLVCAAMLMVGCELAGDPKIDPRNRRDARHTPTLLLAAEVRARAEAADDRREPMTWGRPVTDADGDRYRDLFAGLTPDEVRVITGLVRAMRGSIVEARNAIRGGAAEAQMEREIEEAK